MRIETCNFCSNEAYPGDVIHFVRNDFKKFKFCRSKCLQAFKNRRNPYKTIWTKAYRSKDGKELIQNPAYEFESRKNTPVKYNLELYTKTLEAMKRATEIKHRRADNYLLQRTDHVGVDIIQKDSLIIQSTPSLVEHNPNEDARKAAVMRDGSMDERKDHFVDKRRLEKQLTEELDNTVKMMELNELN